MYIISVTLTCTPTLPSNDLSVLDPFATDNHWPSMSETTWINILAGLHEHIKAHKTGGLTVF